jgi:8-hydroxy-5-deazaflavin:NADPH oxidoreductase
MSYTIAIVGGTGPEGSGLALRWARAGEKIIIGSRDAKRAREFAAQLKARVGSHAQIEGMDNAAAVAVAGVVVLTIPFAAQAATVKQLKAAFRPGTIVIDATVPLAASVGGSPTKTLGVWQGSAAQQVRELLPKEVALAAAFHHVSAERLAADGFVDCDVLICSDDEGARQVAAELAEKIPGCRAINAGKLENARTAEQMTALFISINIRYKVHASGLRITGLPLPGSKA